MTQWIPVIFLHFSLLFNQLPVNIPFSTTWILRSSGLFPSCMVNRWLFISPPSFSTLLPMILKQKSQHGFEVFWGKRFFWVILVGVFFPIGRGDMYFLFQKMPRHPSEQTPITAYGDGILVVGKQPRASKVIPLMVQKSGDRHLEV